MFGKAYFGHEYVFRGGLAARPKCLVKPATLLIEIPGGTPRE
jgi:hypothetical protein